MKLEKENTMFQQLQNRDRMAAVAIGVLYIVGTAAFVLSAIVTAGPLAAQASLAEVAAHRDQVALGTLLVLLAAFALAMVPVVFWPVGRRHNETLAMGYVVFRGAIETILYIGIALGWLLLFALSAEPGAAPLADHVRMAMALTSDQLLAIPFAVGALLFYALLYRSRLVPRWLSGWGLVGAALYLVPPIASMFGSSLAFLMGPLAVQEMALAVWLIARGFSVPAATAIDIPWKRRPAAPSAASAT